MSASYEIRRTLLASDDESLSAIPTISDIVIPSEEYTWESLLGLRGFSAIQATAPGDTLTVLAKVRVGADDFYCVSMNGSYYILAVRDGNIRAHVKLNSAAFSEAVIKSATSQEPVLNAQIFLLELDGLWFVQLAAYGARLLLALTNSTVLLELETLAVVAASGAGCVAAVDSTAPWPSCIAFESLLPNCLVRLDSKLRVIAWTEKRFLINFVSQILPQLAGFLGVALTTHGRVVTLEWGLNEDFEQTNALCVLDPDLKEVHRETFTASQIELFGFDGKLFLRGYEDEERREQNWLLEVIEGPTTES